MKWWQYILFGVCLCVMAAAGFAIGRCRPIEGSQGAVLVKTDTLVVRDTITRTRPVYVNRVKRDTVMLPVLDTVVMLDTVYVVLARENVEWSDGLCTVYASGARVSVDSVTHYLEQKTVTVDRVQQVPRKTRWGLGIQAGYGAGVSGGKVVGVPYVGVGVSCNILSW